MEADYAESNRAGRDQGSEQASEDALHPDCGAVSHRSGTTGGAIQTDGAGCHVSWLTGE